MGDMEVRRDVDRIKAEQDIELGSRVLGGEMVDDFLTRFGRKNEQIAQSLIEEGKLNKEAWRDMSKKQREKVLQDAGYNQYQPESIFGFRVRNTSPDGDWIPTHLNSALEEFSKSGMLEKVLTQVIGPATTTWKHFLLALRPAWQVNNVISNALMMTIAGEVSPSSYLKFMAPGSEAHTLLRYHRLGWDMEQGFGLTKELSRDLLRDLNIRGANESALNRINIEQTAIWFGILVLIVVEVGLITPPVGMNLFIINAMDRSTPMIETYKAVLFFVASDLFRVVLLVLFPAITLFLIPWY
jgi:hypothetical protein